jgi:hypothetical protein
MSQGFLGANPGTTVKDALEPELHDAAVVASVTGSWVEVNFPMEVVAVAEVGAVTGTGVTVDIEVQGADDASGTNLVSYGKFDTITESDDNEDRVLSISAFKRYVRVDIVAAGTSPSAAVRVVLRPKDWERGNTRSA